MPHPADAPHVAGQPHHADPPYAPGQPHHADPPYAPGQPHSPHPADAPHVSDPPPHAAAPHDGPAPGGGQDPPQDSGDGRGRSASAPAGKMPGGRAPSADIGPDSPVVVEGMMQTLLNITQGHYDMMSADKRAEYLGNVNATFEMAGRLGLDRAQARLSSLVGELEAGSYEYSGGWGKNAPGSRRRAGEGGGRTARELAGDMSEGRAPNAHIGPDSPEVVEGMMQSLLNMTQGRYGMLDAGERAAYLGDIHSTIAMAARLGLDGPQARLSSLVEELGAGTYEYSGDWGKNAARGEGQGGAPKRYEEGRKRRFGSARELAAAMSRGELRKAYIGPASPEAVEGMMQSLLNMRQGHYDSMGAHERADYLGRVHETFEMAGSLGLDAAQARLSSLVGELGAGSYEYSGDWGKNAPKGGRRAR